MDRLQRNQPGTLYATWERDGVAVDPGTVTVTVTSDRTGLPVITSASTPGVGPDRSITLGASQTANLDYLTAVWTAADGSQLITYAEVVGSYLFTVGRARKRSPLQDTNTYPTDQVIFYRTLAEMAIEDICGVAFVPRYSRHVASITGTGLLRLPRRDVRRVVQITTATDQGPQALPVLTGLRIISESLVFMPSLWNWWSQPIYVAYEHGMDEPNPRAARAALELARRWIVESPWDERMTSFRTRDGGEMSIMTASNSDPFDLPEVNALADVYGTPLVV